MPRLSLEVQILSVLERALKEGQTEAAEHLLQALEALCRDATLRTPLADACLFVAGERGPHHLLPD